MIHWLYRYVFRGIGLLIVIGMITALYAAIMYIRNQH
jgi:NADH:ubiquinone oxidoreductase subunit 5 (subunit L)/multisubunit Na+/H+ antiporter MnhA subunit